MWQENNTILRRLTLYSDCVWEKNKKNKDKKESHGLYLLFPSLMASWTIFTCTATTDRTSTAMRLNSSKQPQAPVCTRPL